MQDAIYPKWTPYVHAKFLLRNHWPSIAHVAGLSSALLFLCGNQDGMVPPRMSHKLFEAAKGTSCKEFKSFPGGSHEDTWLQPGYFDTIKLFVNKVLSKGQS